MRNHVVWPAIVRTLAVVAALAGVATTAAAADAVEDFYKGKQIRLIVGSTPGGIFDNLGRLMARHMGKFIPGHPAIVVENLPGASSLTAANYVVNSAPRDGTVIASVLSSAPLAETMGKEGVRFKANELSWIGSISRETFIAYVYKTSKIQTLENTLTTETVFGGQAPGAASIDIAVIAKKLFGLKLKIVGGYPGGSETKLALEKGEIDGIFANGWSDLKAKQNDWVRDRTVRIIAQHGLTRHAELPEVPLLLDWAKASEDRRFLEFVLGRNEFAKPYFAAPGVPADRMEALRRAFDRTMTDKDFLAEAVKANVEPDGPMTGQAVAAAIAKMSETPKSMIDRMNAIFDEFGKGL